MVQGLVVRDEIEPCISDDPLLVPEALQRFLADSLPSILLDALRKNARIVAIDGRPGIGKTTVARRVRDFFCKCDVPVALVSTDDDVMPRNARNGHSIIDFHRGDIAKECARIQMHNESDAEFSAMSYTTATGEIDRLRQYHIPAGRGVLVLEGLRSIEYALQIAAQYRLGMEGVFVVYLDAPAYVVNGRRFHRDVREKGLSPDVAQTRITFQEGDLAHYYGDLYREIVRSGASSVRHDVSRVTLEAD